MVLLIPVLFALSIGGLSFVLSQALAAGAETYSGEYSQSTARQFEDVFVFVPPRRIAEIGWAAAAVLFAAVFMLVGSFSHVEGVIAGLVVGIVAGFLGLMAPRWLLAYLKRRRLTRFNEQLVDTLVSMSNALKAGFSITQAFESVVNDGQKPIAEEFGVFLHQIRVGVGFSEALRNLDDRVGSSDLHLVVAAIETARKTGGRLTEVFEKIAVTIRERMRIENRIRTLTAQGRLQGIIVGAMPLVIGIAFTLIDPGLMLPFLRSTIGIAVMVAVVLLVTCGALVIRKIVNIDV